jgi:methylaspartate mutase sigma subunit
MLEAPLSSRRAVVLGVAASDAHVVANHLIAHFLRARGFEVVNLGACTSVAEFAVECDARDDVLALLIGSHNGHALQDLRGLRQAKADGLIRCPVVLGGNLSVGSQKSREALDRLRGEGVDVILDRYEDLEVVLRDFAAEAERSVS